ncbi:MAG: lipoyl protein ligase domain-containing protein [Thermoproteota archaeon]
MISSSSQPTAKASLLSLGNRSIEEALAVFEAFYRRTRAPEAPVVILHSNKGKTVSLGCFQVADEDFITSYLRRKGLKYFFRLHGGDVMLHDENQVGIGLIVPKDEKYSGLHASLIGFLLKKNNLKDFQVTNDYVLCSNKVLGETLHLEKENFSSWFTVIYLKRNYEEIASLKLSKEKMIKERISKLRESCIGLDQLLKKPVSASNLFETIRSVLSGELNFKLKGLRMELADKKVFWKTREMLKKNSISETVQLKYSSMLKEKDAVSLSKMVINGFLRMRVKTRGKTLERMSISGSFVFEPPEKLDAFEKMLEGKELDESLLTEKVTEFFINEKVNASFTSFDIVELLCKAAGGLNEHGGKEGA